jgi:methane monooxygenase component C
MGEMGATQPTRLFFGVNNEQELFAEAEIDVLKSMLPGFKSETCLWKPSEAWGGFTGTPTDALRRDLILALEEGKQPDIYACGPAALINGCERIADELGLVAKKVHSEQFTPS